MYKINILGSCVCRDIFNYDKKGLFSVNKYCNGSSIPSMVADKPKIDLAVDDFNLRSNFEKRSCWLDYEKECFSFIKNSGIVSDYLVISLSDCRIDLAEIWDKKKENLLSFVSYGTTFRENYLGVLLKNKLSDSQIKIYKALDLPFVFFKLSIEKYAKKILSLYSPKKIIVVEDFFVNKYFSRVNEGSGKIVDFKNDEYVNSINNFYRKLYSVLYDNIPSKNIVKFLPNTLADENHKLGLFGLHYVPEFYQYGLEIITKIVQGGYSEEQTNFLQSHYAKLILEKYY